MKEANKVCVVAKKCGGCQYQGIAYHEQLKKKQKKGEDFLKKFGKVEQIIGMEAPVYYRNKIHRTFGRDRKGNAISGTYQEGTHRIVSVEECLIEDKKAQEIVHTIRGLLKSFKIKTYDEDTGYGLLRHVLVRCGKKTGEYMVVLVLGSPIMPSKNNFVKALRKDHPEITTVIVNVNDKRTSMILGEKEQVIYGKGFIRDELCGCMFRISPKSFYQINPIQTEILYKTAVDFAGLTGKEYVIDAYCGIGTIGIVAAKQAKKVLGIELNGDAVRDARMNAKENQITNIEFRKGDAGEVMVAMAEANVKADVVFMDPPRAGSDVKFMSSVVKLNPKRVVYVSCNPETLERDLKYFVKNGYEVKKIQPVEMFPYTEHIECVTLLVKAR
jgi:23S rRNA (uracil1939-C5)-methyltransferase